MKLRQWIAFFIICIPCATANSDDLDKYRFPCQPDQLKDIQNALSKAKDLLTKADAALPPNNSAIGSKFQRWFGGKNGDYDPMIKTLYAEALGFLSFKTFWCPNQSFEGDDPGTFAFVPKGAGLFGEIFIEAEFFKTAEKGADSRAGTIIHELMHLSTHHSIVDLVYKTQNAQALAKSDPQKARINADNYEYFVEDLVDGIPP